MVEEDRKAHMITGCVVARNHTEDLRRITEWLLVARVEECGVAGVKTRGDRMHFKVGGDATSFDREIHQSAIAV
jgi:hypothetical protein